MQRKSPRIAKIIFQRNHKVTWILLHIKALFIAELIKTVWPKDRCIDQWNKIGSQEVKPCKYAQLIFDKDRKAIQRRKDNL